VDLRFVPASWVGCAVAMCSAVLPVGAVSWTRYLSMISDELEGKMIYRTKKRSEGDATLSSVTCEWKKDAGLNAVRPLADQ
jgi:hypothetical protein